jgi:hypothetical protein
LEYSKSKFYDPKEPESHIPPKEDPHVKKRDEVGLIHAITVKVSK